MELDVSSEDTFCTKLDCQNEIWYMLNKEIAYCCGYSQAKFVIPILIIIICIYMIFTYYTIKYVGLGSILLLVLSIFLYFILPKLTGYSMRKKWILYDLKARKLMKEQGMSKSDAKTVVGQQVYDERRRYNSSNRGYHLN